MPEHRARVMEHYRRGGWTIRRLAELLGLDPSEVKKVIREFLPDKVVWPKVRRVVIDMAEILAEAQPWVTNTGSRAGRTRTGIGASSTDPCEG